MMRWSITGETKLLSKVKGPKGQITTGSKKKSEKVNPVEPLKQLFLGL